MPATASTVIITPNADLQAAIDATPAGGTLYLAPGVFTCTTAAGFSITKPITIRGAGCPNIFDGLVPAPAPGDFAGFSTGTIIRVYNPAGTTDGGKDSVGFAITAPAAGLRNVGIYDLGIENPYVIPVFTGTGATKVAVPIGTGDGIRFDGSVGYIGFCHIENVAIRFVGRDGIRAVGASLSQSLDQSQLERLHIAGCREHGMYLKYCTDLTIDNNDFTGNEQCGIYIQQSSQMHIRHNLFNSNGTSFVADQLGTSGQLDWTGGSAVWPYWHQAQMYFQGLDRFSVIGCDFEVWNAQDVPHALALESVSGGVIMANATYNATYPDPVVVGVESWYIALLTEVHGVVVAGNQVSSVTKAIYGIAATSVSGNTVLSFAFSATDNAPCYVDVPGDLDDDVSGTPSGGNFAIVQLHDGSASDLLRGFSAGLQIPTVSSTAALTNVLIPTGTVIFDHALTKLRRYNGATWDDL